VLVAVSGALSGIFVVIANAWMNTPTGFDLIKLPRGQVMHKMRAESVAALVRMAATLGLPATRY